MERPHKHPPALRKISVDDIDIARKRAASLVSGIIQAPGAKLPTETALKICKYNIKEDAALVSIFKSLDSAQSYAYSFSGVTSSRESAEGVLFSVAAGYIRIPDIAQRFDIMQLGVFMSPRKAIQYLKSFQLTHEQNIVICKMAAIHHETFNTKEYLQMEIRAMRSGDNRPFDMYYRKIYQDYIKSHILTYFEEIIETEDAFVDVLRSFFIHDPLGSLLFVSHFPKTRERIQALSPESKLLLLRTIAAHGQGLAFRHIELFDITQTEENIGDFEQLFLMDATAGYSIYGSTTLLYAKKLRPNLKNIEEFDLPEKATSAMLKQANGPTPDKYQSPQENKMSEMDRLLASFGSDDKKSESTSLTDMKFQTKRLQNELAEEFLQRLSEQVGRHWSAEYSDVARRVVFSDKQLIIRQVIFLLTHGLIDGSRHLEGIHMKMCALYRQEGIEKIVPLIVEQKLAQRGITMSKEEINAKLKGTHCLKGEYETFCEELALGDAPVEQIFARYVFAPRGKDMAEEDVYQYSCWYYFFEKLGIDPEQLYGAGLLPSRKAPIEMLKPQTVRFLLNPLMSVHIRSGDAVLKSLKIVWRSAILDAQKVAREKGEIVTEPKIIDDLIQQLAKLLYNIDVLLTIVSPYFSDTIGSFSQVIVKQIRKCDDTSRIDIETGEFTDAYSQDNVGLLIMNRTAIADMIQTTESLCIKTIKHIASVKKISPISLISKLPFPQEILSDISAKYSKYK